MKIVSISDLHNQFPKKMPKGDILTVSGDLCFALKDDYLTQKHHIENFIQWCKFLLDDKIYKTIIWIAGNHDIVLENLILNKKEDEFIKYLPKNVYYLRDNLVEINGIKIYGTPWTPPFCKWGFNTPESKLDDIFSKIPENTDIILSHGPAYSICDNIERPYDKWAPEKLGSKALLKHLKRVCPAWLLTGHIHSAQHIPVELVQGNQIIKCVNVSILSEDYNIIYKPFEFTVETLNN